LQECTGIAAQFPKPQTDEGCWLNVAVQFEDDVEASFPKAIKPATQLKIDSCKDEATSSHIITSEEIILKDEEIEVEENLEETENYNFALDETSENVEKSQSADNNG
jgi:hypothetical protein